ncbi:MAG: class IV adenylate cyclase [Bacteroidota bacterium]|nr:class IV adenylate cyclase [Bacteroidota bacterium]
MPINLELKAKVNSKDNIKSLLNDLGATFECKMVQVDTYFNVSKGRLKLREIDKKESQLIYYNRKESTTEMWSNYQIVKVDEPGRLKEVLAASNGIRVVMKKFRELYKYENCRIHIDDVEELGSFMELEVIHNDSESKTKELFDMIKEKLSAEIEENINESYSDLLLSKT